LLIACRCCCCCYRRQSDVASAVAALSSWHGCVQVHSGQRGGKLAGHCNCLRTTTGPSSAIRHR